MEKGARAVVSYRDMYARLVLSLIAAHYIVSFGEPESFWELLLIWDYWRSLAGSWLIAFILVSAVRWLTLKLDERVGWERLFVRGVLQLVVGVGFSSVLAYLLAAIYFALHGLNILKTEYLSLDFPLIVALLGAFNVYYFGYYMYVVWKKGDGDQVSIDYRKVLVVSRAGKNIPVKVEGIAYFFRINDENFVRTKDREDYLIPESLDQYESLLNPSDFFRANRQFLVSFNSCERYEPLEHDKLELFVNPPYKERIIISQKKASAFRKWMER